MLRHADANDLPVSELPPHRASFYTLALSFGTEDLYYKLNDGAFAEPHNFVLCVAPGHMAHFQHLVNECFLEKAPVADYAQALHVTPNHLSQTIKATTGRTAKSIITEKRMNEAQYLLTYTDNLIADIAYHLGFIEPTHFTKFFKKSAGCSPLQYCERRTAVR